MIARVFDDDNDYSMYYCTLCNRPMKELHQANEHGGFCGKTVPVRPTFEEDDDTQVYKKPWVGLTDEEINDIAKNYALNNPTTPLHFARAIEAAHGIKE